MKKIYRFMSGNELSKLLRGDFIEDKGTWKRAQTSSRGVCFLPKINYKGENYLDFYQKSEILAISNFNSVFLVEFSTDVELKESFGYYPEIFDEYYISGGYDKNILRPTKIALRIDKQIKRMKKGVLLSNVSWMKINENRLSHIISLVEMLTEDFEKNDRENAILKRDMESYEKLDKLMTEDNRPSYENELAYADCELSSVNFNIKEDITISKLIEKFYISNINK